ncbi:hypothetical protein DIZ27_11175 [Streptomyces sp. NWU339]|uniref:hypothetical protein n=1 Tax=Streptomyces sp. NWU339 TaxID=2185284 RepID=UPI000D68137E|nr:hypothetical protein [Streptomyces sp. NWU339]PWI10541.1 hypothetical protein DIZ27_11175 [Streptomyces sp. NWU339]
MGTPHREEPGADAGKSVRSTVEAASSPSYASFILHSTIDGSGIPDEDTCRQEVLACEYGIDDPGCRITDDGDGSYTVETVSAPPPDHPYRVLYVRWAPNRPGNEGTWGTRQLPTGQTAHPRTVSGSLPGHWPGSPRRPPRTRAWTRRSTRTSPAAARLAEMLTPARIVSHLAHVEATSPASVRATVRPLRTFPFGAWAPDETLTCHFTVDPATGVLVRAEAAAEHRTVFRHIVTTLGHQGHARPVAHGSVGP